MWRGERRTAVVYADRFSPRAEQERAAKAGEEPSKVAFLKRLTVFNIAQREGECRQAARRKCVIKAALRAAHIVSLVASALHDQSPSCSGPNVAFLEVVQGPLLAL